MNDKPILFLVIGVIITLGGLFMLIGTLAYRNLGMTFIRTGIAVSIIGIGVMLYSIKLLRDE